MKWVKWEGDLNSVCGRIDDQSSRMEGVIGWSGSWMLSHGVYYVGTTCGVWISDSPLVVVLLERSFGVQIDAPLPLPVGVDRFFEP